MCAYLESQADGDHNAKPFAAVLSWGTPHDPYHTAPPEYAALYPDGCRRTYPPSSEKKPLAICEVIMRTSLLSTIAWPTYWRRWTKRG
jgi:hypothetical protein